MKATARTAIGAMAVAGLLIAGASPALANVERRGACTAVSTWEADVEREGAFFEIDFEVNNPNAGEDWRLVVNQNGKRVFADTRPTTREFDDRLADVDWSFVARDTSGVRDRFEMTATNQVTNERCKVTLRA